MNRAIHLNRNLVTFGVPILLLGILIMFMKSPLLSESKLMSLALTGDLILTVPFIYFLLIRKTEIPKTTVVPFMVIGVLIGSYFLPPEEQTYLELFKTWALPIIEVSLLAYVIIKLRAALAKYKKIKNGSVDFFTTLKSTCSDILPKKLVLPFATEIAVIYYGFFHWKTLELQENEFSYHKNSGTVAIFGALILIIGVETVALHFLLLRWSSVAAWILTILSIYTAIQFLGFAKSLSKRPISVSDDRLHLKYGILNEVEIPFEDIETIILSGKSLENIEGAKTLSPLGELEGHNLIIELKSENVLSGLYGMKKQFKVIGLFLDEPLIFKEKIKTASRGSIRLD